MTDRRGAEFGPAGPRNASGLLANAFQPVPTSAMGLDTGEIFEVTPVNSFRLGQQIVFWVGVANPVVGLPPVQQWLTQIRMKLWWARPNLEFRQPGMPVLPTGPGYLPIDTQTFGTGPSLAPEPHNNRYVWIPSPKRLDVFTPATPGLQNSDSSFYDDVWQFDLPDPTDPAVQALFGLGQTIARWAVFLYPAMGYQLGITYDRTLANQVQTEPPLRLSLTFAIGTLGSTDQGRIAT